MAQSGDVGALQGTTSREKHRLQETVTENLSPSEEKSACPLCHLCWFCTCKAPHHVLASLPQALLEDKDRGDRLEHGVIVPQSLPAQLDREGSDRLQHSR